MAEEDNFDIYSNLIDSERHINYNLKLESSCSVPSEAQKRPRSVESSGVFDEFDPHKRQVHEVEHTNKQKTDFIETFQAPI